MPEKIIKFFLYLVLFLPLAFFPLTMFPWQFGKVIFFQIIIELLLLVYLALLAGRKGGLGLKKLNFLDYSVFIFIFLLFVTALTGANPLQSFFSTQSRVQGAFLWLHFAAYYWLLISLLRGNKEWKKYLAFGALAAVIVSLLAIFQNYLPATWRGDAGPRLSGIIGNPAFLASYLILPIFICAYLGIKSFELKYKIGCFAVSLFFAVTLYFTEIRGAYVGVAAGLGLVSILSLAAFLIKKGWSAKKFALTVAGLILAVIVVLGGALAVNKNLKSQAVNMFQKGGQNTGNTRLMAWQIALIGIKEKPVLGWGMGNYEIVFNQHYNPKFLKYGFLETIWDKPHNWLLEIGVSSGIIGMLSYLMIFAGAGWLIYKKEGGQKGTDARGDGLIREKGNQGKESSGSAKSNAADYANGFLVAGLGAYFVQNLFLFETFNSLLVFSLVLAFISASYEGGRKEINLFSGERIILSRSALLLYALVIMFSLYNFNYLFLKSSYYTRMAEEAGLYNNDLAGWSNYAGKALNISPALKADNAIMLSDFLTKMDKQGQIKDITAIESATVEIAQTLDKAYPRDNYLYPIWSGQASLVLGEYGNSQYLDEAIKRFNSAKAIAPHKQEADILLGRAYLLKKDFANSEKALMDAVNEDPTIGEPHWFLGINYIASSQGKKGLEEIKKAMELGGSFETQESLVYISEVAWGEKDYALTAAIIDRLIKKTPDNITWHIRQAQVYVALGKKKEALAEINRVVELNPDAFQEAQNFIKENKLK